MIKTQGARCTILIDGSNLHASCKALGFTVDFKRLLNSFEGTIYKAFYFTALPPESEQSTLRPMVDYIEYNGFTVVKKLTKEYTLTTPLYCEHCHGVTVKTAPKIKGNMDVEIAITAYEVAPYAEDVFIFTGDGDFRYLVETLQRRYGNFVTVVSTIKTQPVMCAPELRRQADAFIDLLDIRANIERTEDNRRKFGIGGSHA